MTAATGRPVRPGQPVIERASPTDRAFLAMDTGEVPEQFGVILLLDPVGGFDLADARRLIAERVPAVPRLRQRLARAPFGGGGPIWGRPRLPCSGGCSGPWPRWAATSGT
jgi:hypothetical protein